jgi:hypothetical protein
MTNYTHKDNEPLSRGQKLAREFAKKQLENSIANAMKAHRKKKLRENPPSKPRAYKDD